MCVQKRPAREKFFYNSQMAVGHIYSIRDPEGRDIYVGSTAKSDAIRWSQWKTVAKTGDWLACPLLRYAKQRWGNLDACTYHVLTTIELPEDPTVATEVLRRLDCSLPGHCHTFALADCAQRSREFGSVSGGIGAAAPGLYRIVCR